MESSDRQAFIEVVIGFAELKGKQLSAPALELYWEALKDWPLDEFKVAAAHLLKTSEFMPTPNSFEEIRKAGRPTAAEWRFQPDRVHGDAEHGRAAGGRRGAGRNPGANDFAVPACERRRTDRFLV